ncbi:MAG TPA: PHP domain-containing protein, partial [Spirochaetales bacterium]|nr:PHP domain-containing protein [Spirochaetales bacterium]
MSPSRLAHDGAARGLQLMAITDHNAALNAPAFAVCARREGISALYGMEACSAEEAHLLCLFADPQAAADFGEFLAEHLPRIPYDPEQLGDQVVVDEDENVLDMPELYYGAALNLGWDELCESASSRGALVIPAHIDRP